MFTATTKGKDMIEMTATRGTQILQLRMSERRGLTVGAPGHEPTQIGYPINLSAREIDPTAGMHDEGAPGIGATDAKAAELILGKNWRGTGAEAMSKVVEWAESSGATVA